MSEVVLGDGLKIGHPEIDREHQEIVDLLGDWRSRLGTADRERGVLNAAAFRRHLAEHFDNEITIMAEAGFSDVDEHRDFHSNALVRIDAILAKGLDGSGFSRDILDTLIKLFLNDLVPEDMKFKSHLQHKR